MYTTESLKIVEISVVNGKVVVTTSADGIQVIAVLPEA
jgi:hypothetical protein